MLEAERLDQLPQDILNQIWTIYSHWRNIKLWADRYQGFRHCNVETNIIKVNKANINVISDIIKYNIPDESRGYPNYHDILYLKCTVDIRKYSRICGHCGGFNCLFDSECSKCKLLFCRSCVFYGNAPQIKDKSENGVWILKECPYCKAK